MPKFKVIKKCGDCRKSITFCRDIGDKHYCLKCAPKYETPIQNIDECVACGKEVVVDYETGKGYTIANCNNCDKMLCRDCLESGTEDMCKYCNKKEAEDDVCCVGCGEVVCKFSEEPPHKDDREEAVCPDCFSQKL